MVSKFGPACFELAEDSFQEACVKAMMAWPAHGVPDDPAAWLFRVACHKAIDGLRRSARAPRLDPGLVASIPALEDPELEMVLLCCDSRLPPESQIVLVLKAVLGFGSQEIARGLGSSVAAVERRVARAKSALAKLPEQEAKPDMRCATRTVYLVFNEGYAATKGNSVSDLDVCLEAVSLARRLWERCPDAELAALMALMLFHSSRLEAKHGPDGEFVPLGKQNPDQWDQAMVSEGFMWLGRASEATEVTPIHLEAGIAACEATRPTDWHTVVALYDQLAGLNPSPVVLMNRAVAIGQVSGPKAALAELALLEADLASNHYFLAAKAEMWERLGETSRARRFWSQAARLAQNGAERAFLSGRSLHATPQEEHTSGKPQPDQG